MRELALFREYLVQLRAERLQQEHAHAKTGLRKDFVRAVACAHQAILVEAILDALKELDSDQDEFVHRYLEKK